MYDEKRLYVTQGSGNSIKPMLALSQTNQKCHIAYMDVLAGQTKSLEFLNINPLGVVPYLVLADGTGLGESNAIAWYLAEGSSLIPQSSIARAQTIRWMNFEQTSLEPNISPVRFFTHIVPDKAKEHSQMIPVWREQGNQALSVLNSHLQKNDFIADKIYCIADICVFGYTHLANEGGFDLASYPAIENWIERVVNQTGYVPIGNLLDGFSDEINLKAA